MTSMLRAWLHLAAVAGVLCMQLAGSAAAQEKEIRIAVLAYRGEQAARASWQPTADYLSKSIPGHRFVIVPHDNATLGPAVKAERVDFVITNPGSYTQLSHEHGVTRKLTMRNFRLGEILSEFGAVIFTRADRGDIATLSDLKGKSFMGVDKDAFGGFQMAWRELLEAGIDPFRHFSRLEFSGLPQDTIVYAVRDGKVDAGTVRTDTLESMAAEGRIHLRDYRVIGARQHEGFPFLVSTRLYPEWAFARLRHVPEGLAQEVLVALLNLSPYGEVATASGSAGWAPPRDYAPVDELFRALRVGPYEGLGGFRLVDVIVRYWQWIAAIATLLALMAMTLLHILRLNRRLSEAGLRLAQQNLELQRLSSQDSLTGIANHRLFEERLAYEWARAVRDKSPLTVIMADIDNFKKLNDTDGHQAGDECLRRVAKTLEQAVHRQTDLLARYGGEEFVAILPSVDAQHGLVIAEQMRKAVEALDVPNRGIGGPVTISLGVAGAVPQHGMSAESLVARADQALYAAKAAGRNQSKAAPE